MPRPHHPQSPGRGGGEKGGEEGPLAEVMYILIEVILHICKLSAERRGPPPSPAHKNWRHSLFTSLSPQLSASVHTCRQPSTRPHRERGLWGKEPLTSHVPHFCIFMPADGRIGRHTFSYF